MPPSRPPAPQFRQHYAVYFGHHLVHSHGWNMSYVTTNIFFLIWIDFGLMFSYYCNDCTDVQYQGVFDFSYLGQLFFLIGKICDGDELSKIGLICST